ncbi:MAG: hypothetical protein V1755_00600 [Chloroflexota bacterium]
MSREMPASSRWCKTELVGWLQEHHPETFAVRAPPSWRKFELIEQVNRESEAPDAPTFCEVPNARMMIPSKPVETPVVSAPLSQPVEETIEVTAEVPVDEAVENHEDQGGYHLYIDCVPNAPYTTVSNLLRHEIAEWLLRRRGELTGAIIVETKDGIGHVALQALSDHALSVTRAIR